MHCSAFISTYRVDAVRRVIDFTDYGSVVGNRVYYISGKSGNVADSTLLKNVIISQMEICVSLVTVED